MARFRSLELENFRLFKSASLKLENRGMVLILGENRDTTSAESNGSAKTTLISEGPTYPLFGKTAKGKGGDRLLRRGESRLSASITFDGVDGGDYRVHRVYKPSGGRGALTVYKNGYPEGGSGDKQDLIEQACGFDLVSWRNTVLFAQGDHDHFGEDGSTDSDQKAILKRILGLDDYNQGLVAIRKVRNAKADEVREAEKKLSFLRGRLQGLPDPSGLKDKIDKIKKEADVAGSFEKVEEISATRNKVVMVLEAMSKLREKRDLALVAKSKISVESAKIMQTVSTLLERIKDAEKELEDFKDGKCPTCGSTSEESVSVVAKLASIGSKLKAYQQMISAKKEEGAARKEEEKKHEEDISRMNARLAEESRWREHLAGLDREKAELERALDKAQNAAHQLIELQGQLRELLGKIEAAEREIKKREDELKDLENELLHFDFWVHGFGNQGIPAFLMGVAVPDIIESANEYLDILSDGYLQLFLEEEKELKKGEVRKRFRRSTTIGGLEDVDTGGAEGRKVSIAIDLAFLDISTRRDRGSNIVILDEVLDGLDSVGKKKVEALFSHIRQMKESIFVVSHDPAMKEWFDNVVTVVKENGGSRILEGD